MVLGIVRTKGKEVQLSIYLFNLRKSGINSKACFKI